MFNAGQKGLKGSADEGGVRVPFFIRWKGTLEAGRDISKRRRPHRSLPHPRRTRRSHQSPKSKLAGRSLLPLLKDPKSAWPDRYLFTQTRPAGLPDPNQTSTNGRTSPSGATNTASLTNNSSTCSQTPAKRTTSLAKHPEDRGKKCAAAYDKFWKEARPLMVNETAPMSPTQPFRVDYQKQLVRKRHPKLGTS